MARKNPVGKLAKSTLNALKDPKGTAGKMVDQAKGTAALGKMATDTAGALVGKAARRVGRRGADASAADSVRGAAPAAPAGPQGAANLRAVPDVEEPAQARPTTSPKKQGDALLDTRESGAAGAAAPKSSTAKKAPAKKAAAKQTAAKQTAAKKAPAKQASAKQTAAKKTSAKKAPAKTASPADVADVVESAVAEDPSKTAATPAKKASAAGKPAKSATESPGDKLPAKKTTAKKAPTKKAPTKKTAAKKTAAKKTAAKKTQPKSASELAAAEGEDVRTPAGTSAASEGTNPSTGDTDLTQPGTESVVDPATATEVATEAARLRKAAENNPE